MMKIQKFEDVGQVLLYPDEDEIGPFWNVVVEVGESGQLDLENSYPTAGEALDAALKWAEQRALHLRIPLLPVQKKIVDADL